MSHAFSLGVGTILRFQGKDRCRVFNNLCTQDLRKLSHGQSAETFVTDVKGRVFGHGIAFGIGDDAYFITVPGQAERLVPHFDRYIIREDAIVSDLSLKYDLFLFSDCATVACAFELDIDQVPTMRESKSIERDGNVYFLCHASWIGPESVLCLVPSEGNAGAGPGRLADELIVSDLSTRRAWEHLRIQAFWPWYGTDMDEKNLPQELDRDELAISFNKGCYLGQETIARLDALGQVQKKLVKLRIECSESPSDQTPVYSNDKEVGTVRSAAMVDDSAVKQCIAMAYVKRSHFSSGTELSVNDSPAVVV